MRGHLPMETGGRRFGSQGPGNGRADLPQPSLETANLRLGPGCSLGGSPRQRQGCRAGHGYPHDGQPAMAPGILEQPGRHVRGWRPGRLPVFRLGRRECHLHERDAPAILGRTDPRLAGRVQPMERRLPPAGPDGVHGGFGDLQGTGGVRGRWKACSATAAGSSARGRTNGA